MLADGSEYRGNLNNEAFDGYGQFTWPKFTSNPDTADQVGHMYIGQWKDGKMHGEGEFHHAQGHVLGSHFSKGLVNLEGKLYASPFQTKEEHAALLQRIQLRAINEAKEAKELHE